MAQTIEEVPEEDLVIPVCKSINESEMHQISFSIPSNLTQASFLMDFSHESSGLDMVLETPNGERIDSTAGDPIIYKKENLSIYYIIPMPEEGDWTVEITARAVPETGEEYCAYMVPGDEYEILSDVPSNLSEELDSEECESCKSD